MLKFSPLFGSFIATIILIIYSSIEAGIKLTEIGVIFTIFPLIFIITSIFSYIAFFPLKIFIVKKQSESFWGKRIAILIVSLVSLVIALALCLLDYYFENNKLKAFFLFLAIYSCLTFSMSFYISLGEELNKNNK